MTTNQTNAITTAAKNIQFSHHLATTLTEEGITGVQYPAFQQTKAFQHKPLIKIQQPHGYYEITTNGEQITIQYHPKPITLDLADPKVFNKIKQLTQKWPQ